MSPQPAPDERRLAQRLDAEIAAARDPLGKAVLQVQRAVLDLRHGRQAQARTQLDRLHAELLRQPDLRLAGWLQLAEGQCVYFSSFGLEARERFLQALALSQSAADPELGAWAHVWLAQSAAVNRALDDVIRHAAHARQHWQALGTAVRFRLAGALGAAWTLAGEADAARDWDGLARQLAGQEGDDAGLAAVVFNQTLRRVARLRRDALDGQPREAPGQLLGVDSVGHLDLIAGGSVRGDLTPLLRAQLLALLGDWGGAASLLEAQLPGALAGGLRQVAPSLLAELAWCRARLGEQAKARRVADWAASLAPVVTELGADGDELVAMQQRLTQAYELLGDEHAAARHREALTQAEGLERHQHQQWSAALQAAGLRELPRP